MSDEQLEEIALFIENAGNSAYKGTDWHSAPGYMAAARIVRRYKAGGDLHVESESGSE